MPITRSSPAGYRANAEHHHVGSRNFSMTTAMPGRLARADLVGGPCGAQWVCISATGAAMCLMPKPSPFDYSSYKPRRDYHYHTTGRYTSQNDITLVFCAMDSTPIYGRKETPPTCAYFRYLRRAPAQPGSPPGLSLPRLQCELPSTGCYVLKASGFSGAKETPSRSVVTAAVCC
jgi:hypothetical protein